MKRYKIESGDKKKSLKYKTSHLQLECYAIYLTFTLKVHCTSCNYIINT